MSGSRGIIIAIRSAGGNPMYGELAGAGHNIWQPLYDDAPSSATRGQLYDWMFSQQAVPEPTTAVLIAPLALGLLARRRPNRRG